MTRKEAIHGLLNHRCACGGSKSRSRAFCGACYTALPAQLRNRLWSRIGRGFEEAYEEATNWLKNQSGAPAKSLPHKATR